MPKARNINGTRRGISGGSKLVIKDNEFGLNPKQLKFCLNYSKVGADTFSNGVRSYADAYDFDLDDVLQYNSCKAQANVLLQREDVTGYLAKALKDLVLTDEIIDAQLAALIYQHENKSVKLGAIAEYNKVRGRIKNQAANLNILTINNMELSLKDILKGN